jgi:copper chaperone CopZ
MKNYFLGNLMIILAASFIFSCAGNTGKNENTTKSAHISVEKENLRTIKLSVEGMTCTGCEVAIVNSLSRLDGVNKTEASYTDGEALITFDTLAVSVDEMKRVIVEAGYRTGGFEVVQE